MTQNKNYSGQQNNRQFKNNGGGYVDYDDPEINANIQK